MEICPCFFHGLGIYDLLLFQGFYVSFVLSMLLVFVFSALACRLYIEKHDTKKLFLRNVVQMSKSSC